MIPISEEVGSVLAGLSFQNIPAKRSEPSFCRKDERVLVPLSVLSKLIPVSSLYEPRFLFKKKKSVLSMV